MCGTENSKVNKRAGNGPSFRLAWFFGAETYCSLSDSALAELVEVDEELLDTDSVLGDTSLDTLFNIGFMTKDSGLSLVIALMTVSRGADVLSVITD